jgi:hypothetical protein
LAERFYKLLEAVKAQLPDFADSLPTPITSNGHHAMLGYSDANQVDLAVYLEELSSVVNYADE